MKEYNIYAGLAGGFGGAKYYSTILAENEDEALDYAFERACEDYEMYEGKHGLTSWSQIAEENELDPEEDYDTIEEMYMSERDSWLSMRVVPTDEDSIGEDSLVREHDLS